MVFLDGKLVGVTPVKVPATPGPHELRLEKAGFVTRKGTVSLNDAKDFELRMAVSLTSLQGATSPADGALPGLDVP